MMNPKNKYYLTSADFPQYQDDLGRQLEAEDRLNGITRTPFKLSDTENDMRTKNITFVVTERCNLDCTYCYETHKTGRRMTKEVAKEAVDCILDSERMKGYYDAEFSNNKYAPFIDKSIYEDYKRLEIMIGDIFDMLKVWTRHPNAIFIYHDNRYDHDEVKKYIEDKQKEVNTLSESILDKIRNYLQKLDVIS